MALSEYLPTLQLSNSPLLICGLALLSSLLINFIYLKLASLFHGKSKSNFRRLEENPIPLTGGLAIYTSLFITNYFIKSQELNLLLISGLPILVGGIADDFYEVSARFKLIPQFISTSIMIYLIKPENLIYTEIFSNEMVGIFLSALFLMTLCSAFNFLDGMDGQLGSIAIATLAVLSILVPELQLQSMIMCFAVIGFLVFNFPPAKVYLGEVGSSLLGYLCGAVTLQMPYSGNPIVSFTVIAFLFSFVFWDLLASIKRRISRGQKPWTPDREHFHHKLLAIGLNKKTALLITASLSFASCMAAWTLQEIPDFQLFLSSALIMGGSIAGIYYGIGFCYSNLGEKVSSYGKIFLERYFQRRNLVSVEPDMHGIELDFLPYFIELQSRGPSAVNQLIVDIKSVLLVQAPIREAKILDNNRVLFIFNHENKLDYEIRLRVCEELFKVFHKHNVVRSQFNIPEGVKFHTDISRLISSSEKQISATNQAS